MGSGSRGGQIGSIILLSISISLSLPHPAGLFGWLFLIKSVSYSEEKLAVRLAVLHPLNVQQDVKF